MNTANSFGSLDCVSSMIISHSIAVILKFFKISGLILFSSGVLH